MSTEYDNPRTGVFAFDAAGDREPSAAMVEPGQDESVVATAKVGLIAECRDDYELKAAGVEIATRIGNSDGESLALEQPAEIAGVMTAARLERELDIAKLRVSAGDSVVLRAFAEDRFDGTGVTGVGHGRSRSAARVLRIVGDEEFERQIRSTLAGVRRDAMRTDERQARAREELARSSTDNSVDEVQATVTDGLARMRESTEQVLARLSRNGRNEGILTDLARQAQDIAAAAEARSAEASEALDRARNTKDTPEGKERKAEAEREASERQDEVRAELEDLVALLDRDEDAWVARRRLDGLTNRLRQLARETQQLSQRSTGASREQLAPEARAEIDGLSERQSKAADEAERTIAEMKERARTLEQADAQQARALDGATKAAEEGRVREEIDQAAERTKQNMLEQARAAQERAIAALERAAQALEEDQKSRAKELARMMEDLVRSIRRLIEELEVREADLRTVADGQTEQDMVVRQPLSMQFGLLSQNTRGIASDARMRSREATRAARSLEAAANSMAGVASGLRAVRFSREDSLAAADAARRHLDEALKAAEEAAERAADRATQEKREELLKKYRDLLAAQAMLRESVERLKPAAMQPLGRREMVESRRLSTSQEEIRLSVRAILDTETDVKDSEPLVELHEVIDQALAEARTRLSAGDPAAAIEPQDDSIESLSAIVNALDEMSKAADEDMFAERQSQQSGSDGGSRATDWRGSPGRGGQVASGDAGRTRETNSCA